MDYKLVFENQSLCINCIDAAVVFFFFFLFVLFLVCFCFVFFLNKVHNVAAKTDTCSKLYFLKLSLLHYKSTYIEFWLL